MEGDGVHVTEEAIPDTSRIPRRLSRKVIAVAVVAALLGVSGLCIWYEYYRHWNIRDVENALILDEGSAEFYPLLLGFRSNLEGRTITVDIEVGSTRTYTTNLGQLNYIYPEGGNLVAFMLWGARDFEQGDRIGIEVTFERSVINGNEAVYSPQISLPGFGILASVQEVVHSVSWIMANYVATVTDSGDDVVVQVCKASEPIPLEIARCTLRAGSHTDAMEYIDVLGGYSTQPDVDAIPNLTISEGYNATICFSDINDDGYLDDGDSFTLRNLTRPMTASGAQTYLFSVERDLYPAEPLRTCYTEGLQGVFTVYLIMTEDGPLLVQGQTPVGRSFISTKPDYVSMTLDYMSEPVSWDDIRLLFSYDFEFLAFSPNSTSMATGTTSSQVCEMDTIRDVTVECVITDVEGNGFAEEGDKVEFYARNNTHFNESRESSIRIMYIPVGAEITMRNVDFLASPESDCLLSIRENFTTITLTPIHNGTDRNYESIDVVWDDVVVRMADGKNQTEWNLTSDDLEGLGIVEWTYAERTLGNLSVICTVVDLQGNGLANTGDRVEVVVAAEDAYDQATEYTVALEHIPTGADIFSATFTG